MLPAMPRNQTGGAKVPALRLSAHSQRKDGSHGERRISGYGWERCQEGSQTEADSGGNDVGVMPVPVRLDGKNVEAGRRLILPGDREVAVQAERMPSEAGELFAGVGHEDN